MKKLQCLNVSMICCSLLFIMGCGSDQGNNSKSKNVFLDKQRRDPGVALFGDEKFPLDTIGFLDSSCTATLVAKSLVLTTKHCVVDTKNNNTKPVAGFFYPKFKNTKIAIKRIWFSTLVAADKNSYGNDWALLELATPAVENQNFMKLSDVDFSKAIPVPVNFAGFDSVEKRPLLDNNCAIVEVKGDQLYNTCRLREGGSGGAPYNVTGQTPTIVALMVGDKLQGAPQSLALQVYDNKFANVAISVKPVINVFNTVSKALETNTAIGKIQNVAEIALSSGTSTNPSGQDVSVQLGRVDQYKPVQELARKSEEISSSLAELSYVAAKLAHPSLYDEVRNITAVAQKLKGQSENMSLDFNAITQQRSMHQGAAPEQSVRVAISHYQFVYNSIKEIYSRYDQLSNAEAKSSLKENIESLKKQQDTVEVLIICASPDSSPEKHK